MQRDCLTLPVMAPSTIPFLLLFLMTTKTLSLLEPWKPNDTNALTTFCSTADPHGILAANWTTSDACSGHWLGVTCSFGRVTSLSLPSLDLRGPLTSLFQLNQLRLLDLHSNKLNGSLTFLTSLSNLRLVYLSGNDFSGSIPPTISRLTRLLRIDLSDNSLYGPIPTVLSNLTHLLTLRLHNNLLSGPVPDLTSTLPHLTEFNASNNELSGGVPATMITKFGLQSMAGNVGLCGQTTPLPRCSSSPHQSVVQSSPTSMPATYNVSDKRRRGPITRIIIISNGVFLLVLLSLFLSYCCCYSMPPSESDKVVEGRQSRRTQKGGRDSEESEVTKNKLVFIDSGDRRRTKQRFQLEELLKASAELVGVGSLGTVYRAVLEDGQTVAVKRLRDARVHCKQEEFHKYMDLIGQLIHPNLLPLRAYYFVNEEMLPIYDFLPNGSLHSFIHGNQGTGRKPLDWTTRISLVLGVARGLAHIHEQCRSHGSVKSSNVLLDKNGVACLSDFGLAMLLSHQQATARLGGYGAPELTLGSSRKLSLEADVYGFGMLLLEVLTGRVPTSHPSPLRPLEKGGNGSGAIGLNLPEWVRSVVSEERTSDVFDPELMRYKNVEDEMVALLQMGLVCVAQRPERRPIMAEVVRFIEDVWVEQSPLAEVVRFIEDVWVEQSPLAEEDDASSLLTLILFSGHVLDDFHEKKVTWDTMDREIMWFRGLVLRKDVSFTHVI